MIFPAIEAKNATQIGIPSFCRSKRATNKIHKIKINSYFGNLKMENLNPLFCLFGY